ncbi:MAG: thioredoxin-dependent thiol peroxidase [Patescibacteria group bacterium]
MIIQEKQLAPDFSLSDQGGHIHALVDYRGKWVLLYFYPKDDTPGCTTEACGMRDHFPDFTKLSATVLGVSVDSVESHLKFADKYHLTFPLLSDENKDVVMRYGVWREKVTMGKKSIGTKRTSFLIDPEGRVAKIYENVKPELHAQEVLKNLNELQAA